MNKVKVVFLIVVIVLSLAAGAAKLMLMPQEVQFFDAAGLGTVPLVILGLIQIAGGTSAIFAKARKPGLALIALGFLASAAVIFMTGNTGFAIGSLIPVVVTLWLWLQPRQLPA